MILLTYVRMPLIAVAIFGFCADASGQNLRDAVRRQALRDPKGTVHLPASPGHYEAKSIEELESESVVVVTGKLRRKSSYLGSTGDRVLTDYNIAEVSVISGRLSSPPESIPGEPTLPVVTVWGGEIVLDGIRVRAVDVNFEHALQDGEQYLVFLRTARPPASGRYEIYHGAIFKIGPQHLTPLLKRGDAVFAWAAELPLLEVIAKIRASGKGY